MRFSHGNHLHELRVVARTGICSPVATLVFYVWASVESIRTLEQGTRRSHSLRHRVRCWTAVTRNSTKGPKEKKADWFDSTEMFPVGARQNEALGNPARTAAAVFPSEPQQVWRVESHYYIRASTAKSSSW